MRMSRERRGWAWVSALVVLGLGACTGELDEFEDTFDTEFTVPPPVGAAQPFEKTKRFKLEDDPNDAESVRFKRAKISVVAPAGSDLAFLSRLEVFVKDEEDALTLVGTAEGFRPGETSRSLNIEFDGDLRGFVSDQRVRFTWIVYPVAWGYAWPEEGVTLRTDVTLLVNADLF